VRKGTAVDIATARATRHAVVRLSATGNHTLAVLYSCPFHMHMQIVNFNRWTAFQDYTHTNGLVIRLVGSKPLIPLLAVENRLYLHNRNTIYN
jgi:hypothetical protein